MCGIAGLWQPGISVQEGETRLSALTGAIAYRGPDGEGGWSDPDAGLYLGHRRLAIFDLSDAGRQPMISADGRWALVLNGEIYNFPSLRQELISRGVIFRSRSDTEVLLELIACDGLAVALPRLQGMFAIALWDRKTRCLNLVRDAFGKKPLLYSASASQCRFASEASAFLADRASHPLSLNQDAAHLMLSFGVVPEPFSILNNVQKLPPGHRLEVTLSANGQLSLRTSRWFTLTNDDVVLQADPLELFTNYLTSAVSQRLAADVPVGAFLSGGIDSSLVAAYAQGVLDRPLKTFTIGFDTPGFDEAQQAAAVAHYLGTEHHELRLSPELMVQHCLAAASWFDEPFADPSAIPTRLLSAYARESVTVCLTGDGGDEAFLGYPLHWKNAYIVSVLAATPLVMRRQLSGILNALPGNRAKWWGWALGQMDPYGYYLSQRMGGFLANQSAMAMVAGQLPPWSGRKSDAEWLADCDLGSYLVNDMLVKVDRASMSVGLEARNPLLDQRIVQFARSLPLARKVGKGVGKLLLRQALAKKLPDNLIHWKKKGFRAPIGYWLNRSELRDWSEAKARSFDQRFGWRTQAGLTATDLWRENQSSPAEVGRDLWRVCQLMDWSNRHGL